MEEKRKSIDDIRNDKLKKALQVKNMEVTNYWGDDAPTAQWMNYPNEELEARIARRKVLFRRAIIVMVLWILAILIRAAI